MTEENDIKNSPESNNTQGLPSDQAIDVDNNAGLSDNASRTLGLDYRDGYIDGLQSVFQEVKDASSSRVPITKNAAAKYAIESGRKRTRNLVEDIESGTQPVDHLSREGNRELAELIGNNIKHYRDAETRAVESESTYKDGRKLQRLGPKISIGVSTIGLAGFAASFGGLEAIGPAVDKVIGLTTFVLGAASGYASLKGDDKMDKSEGIEGKVAVSIAKADDEYTAIQKLLNREPDTPTHSR